MVGIREGIRGKEGGISRLRQICRERLSLDLREAYSQQLRTSFQFEQDGSIVFRRTRRSFTGLAALTPQAFPNLVHLLRQS